ncbi:MAG: hypothetical protein AB1Z31_27880 [Desulfobacterales bacterium]
MEYWNVGILGKKSGMSRSELYSKAVSDYINAHKNEDVTKALNRIYAEEKSEIDPAIIVMQLRSLPKESW